MPNVILKKITGNLLIGSLCIFIGVVMFFSQQDLNMFMLSLCVSIIIFIKTFLLYRRIKRGEFVTIKGICTKISSTLFAGNKIVYIETDEDVLQMYLTKDTKVNINEEYIFYFKKDPSKTTIILNNYITSKLNTENFFGYEKYSSAK